MCFNWTQSVGFKKLPQAVSPMWVVTSQTNQQPSSAQLGDGCLIIISVRWSSENWAEKAELKQKA